MGPVQPTAARACLLTKLPTISESTVLYSCWKRFPSINGTAKAKSSRDILPWVISVSCLALCRIDNVTPPYIHKKYMPVSTILSRPH